MLDELDIVPLTDTLGTGVFELVDVVVVVPLTDTLDAGVFELVCVVVVVPLTDTLDAGVFEVVCDVVDVNDCEELLDKVVEPLADDERSVVLLTDSDVDNDTDSDADNDADSDKLAVCVPDGDTVGDADIDCTGPVYNSINAVFVDEDQKTANGGLAVEVV